MSKDKKNTLIVVGILFIAVIIILFLENGTRVLVDEKYEDLTGIVIDSDLADIEVKYIRALDVNVLVYGRKNDNIEYYEDENILYMYKKSTRGFCMVNCNDKIILYLPEKFQYINIKTDMGKLDLNEVEFDKALISSSVGDISIGKVHEVDITSDIGNVTIERIDGTSDSSIITKSGSVKIKNTSNLDIDAETYTGKKDIKKTKDNEFTLKVKTDTGSIKVG